MTKEELKQEANKYAKEITEKYVFMEHGRASALGYLAGAEPREKQIEIDAEQIRALQKQNGELTDKVKNLEDKVAQVLEDNNILQNENTVLKMDSKNNSVIYNCSTCRIKNNYKQSKELLNKMLAFITPNEFGDYPIIKESAEQFLGEVEK